MRNKDECIGMWLYPHGWNGGGYLPTDICPTISTSAFTANFFLAMITKNNLLTTQKQFYIMEQKVRIRKLTPRECFRLMDVSDKDIDKIQASGVSKSQQYKMAGNSIVVAVLEGIFDKMFINKQVSQPTLFDLL